MSVSSVQQLVSAFEVIHRERMQGLNFLHPQLRVEATEFIRWQERPLGVLVTPWFMNLMLLPAEKPTSDVPQSEPAVTRRVGDKVRHVFPSGDYEFTVGREDAVGFYEMCSLFSPMQSFENHEAAMATAHAVLEALMDDGNQEKLDNYEYWDGDPRADKPADASDTVSISRRNLFRGRLQSAADSDSGSLSQRPVE